MPQPKLLPKPWASDGLKNNIPAERSGGLAQEAATYAEGFPNITMTPISVGGKPPSGKDMNGVLYEISAHTVWQNQGGRYRFDQAFCDAIGGYPKGAVLINDTLDTEYISLVDANTHNPNSGNNTGQWEIHAGKGLKASTIRAGIVQLSSATNSDCEDIAATPKAVKTAYDKAVAAESAASDAVKTSGSQTVGGEKTFTGTAFFKAGAFVADSVGDFAANQYLQIGSNNVNSYFYNKRSGKYLSMRNDGELRYDGKRILNADDLANMMPSGDKAANGWCRLPNGLIDQWGEVLMGWQGEGPVKVVFPIAFTSECFNVQITAKSSGRPGMVATDLTIGAGEITATGFSAMLNTWAHGAGANDFQGFAWRAIGK